MMPTLQQAIADERRRILEQLRRDIDALRQMVDESQRLMEVARQQLGAPPTAREINS